MFSPCRYPVHSGLVSALIYSCLSLAWGANGGWHTARATYFDAPQYWKEAFQPGNQFGDLYGNSCQYLNRREGVAPSNDGFPLPFDGVGAITDAMAAHVGSCGRCFELRCRSGEIMSDYNQPLSVYDGLHLPNVAPSGLKDPEGREWPGVPDDSDPNIRYTQCRDESATAVITIIDSCPCTYIGGRKQQFCCGPMDHFDLSFWAFNKLAHPLYGMMMMDYRPVDCTTHEPLDDGKPYISEKIYADRPEAGWGWSTYSEKDSTMIAEGHGLNGSAATCVRLTPGGGLAFWCRDCHLPGAQPFDREIIQFWVRSDAKDDYTFTPQGKVPKLQLFLSQMHELTYSAKGSSRETEKFCSMKPSLGNYKPLEQDGDWFLFRVPIADFHCAEGITPATSNKLVFENPGQGITGDAIFCLDEVEII